MKKESVDNSIQMSEDEVIKKEFMRRFSTWNIPIEHIDVTLSKVPNEVRQQHYQELKDIISKDAFKREVNDWKRRVARTLSMGIWNNQEITELQKQGLRMFMIEIENFEETLSKRAMLTSPVKPLRALSEKI